MKIGKRFILLYILVLFVLIFMPFDFIGAKGEEKTYQDALNNSIFEQLEMLDLEDFEEYLQSIEQGKELNLKERLLSFISGEALNYESFFQGIAELLFSKVKKILPAFACIAAIAILCGLLNTLQSNFLGESSARIVFFISYLGALIPLLSILASCIISAKGAVASMVTQMQLVFPIMLTLMAASGGTVSVAIYKPSVAFLSNALVSLIDLVVFPLTICVIVFSMASKFFGEIKTDKFVAFFKSINKWIIGVGVSVFGLFFTIQGLTAASYDGIVRRAAKYAIGTGVPIVGGFLSGGFDLTVAGSILIKNSLGTFSLFLLCAVVIEPLILFAATILMLRLTSAVTQPFGESKISGFLEETAENLNYFIAGILFTAFLYFVVILLLVCSSEVFI